MLELSDRLKRMEELSPAHYGHIMELSKAQEKGTEAPSVFKAGLADRSKAFDTEAKTAEFLITQKSKDRAGDVVHPEGLDTKNYRKNPVFLWAHNDWGQPIGKSLSETVEGDGMKSVVQFDAKSDFAMSVFDQYVDGFMNAVSIRFIPKEFSKILIDGEDGASVWDGGFEFTKTDLLEHSAVPIPCLPEALALAAPAVMSMAKSLGMDVGDIKTDLGMMVAGAGLVKRYPELFEDDGLRKIIKAAVSEAMGGTEELFGIPEQLGTLRKTVDDIKAALEGGAGVALRQESDAEMKEILDALKQFGQEMQGAA